MLKDLVLWLTKMALQMAIWGFVFSIPYQGKPLFQHVHSVLIDNEIVYDLNEHREKLWKKVKKSVDLTFNSQEKDVEEF